VCEGGQVWGHARRRGFKLESDFLSIQSTRRYFLKKWCVTGSGPFAETADFAAENFLIAKRKL